MLQAVLFPVASFTTKDANKWLKEHKYKKNKPFHKTDNYLRARLVKPDPTKRYYSTTLPNGIILVSHE